MHSDHLGGLSEIIHQLAKLGDQPQLVYFNAPFDSQVLTEAMQNKVVRKLERPQVRERVDFLYESLEQVRDLRAQLFELGIRSYPALAGTALLPPPYARQLRIIGPTPRFYAETMNNAGLTLQWELFATSEILVESAADGDPCRAIERHRDPDWDNQVSVVLELVTARDEKCLFTADASEPSFASIEQAGHPLTNYTLVQLPHHGSRRNLDAARVRQFGASTFWVAAPQNGQHPSPDLLSCIGQAVPGSQIYSTHELT